MPYTIASNTLAVQLSDDANGRLNADAIRMERIDDGAGSGSAPDRTRTLSDDTGVFDFGTATTGVPLSYTFTVRNLGGSPLTLDEPISVPSGFSLVSSFGSTTLATDETTTFTIRIGCGIFWQLQW